VSNDKPLTLYLSHRRDLVNYATGIVGDRAHAEDVVQEAWLRFGEAMEGRGLAEPLGYLYRIVRNLAVDGRRRLTRERRLMEPDAEMAVERQADDTPSPEAEALARDELRLLMAAMAELPDRTRVALEMHRFGGATIKDIAGHLGISVGLVHSLLVDGLEHCRARLCRRP
jgi:RNA polymerase sigma factor, sigma-70 family